VGTGTLEGQRDVGMTSSETGRSSWSTLMMTMMMMMMMMMNLEETLVDISFDFVCSEVNIFSFILPFLAYFPIFEKIE
jgi:membrane-associated HD superfamily phosphohydrolase